MPDGLACMSVAATARKRPTIHEYCNKQGADLCQLNVGREGMPVMVSFKTPMHQLSLANDASYAAWSKLCEGGWNSKGMARRTRGGCNSKVGRRPSMSGAPSTARAHLGSKVCSQEVIKWQGVRSM